MSTTPGSTLTATRTVDGRALAVALGVVRSTVAPVGLPALTLAPVPGRSPLEASGWAPRA